MMMFSKGSFKKYVTRLGKRGVAKKMTKCGIGGGGLSQRVMSLIKKKYFKNGILIDQCVLLSPFYWHFYVVVYLANMFCAENILFLENIGPTIHIKFWLISSPEFVIFREWQGGGG